MINIQVRMYKENLEFSHKITINLEEDQAKFILGMLFDSNNLFPKKGYKKVWLTNMMIRRGGKLISYKEFKRK